MHSQLGVLGITGFLMKDLSANPLDYVEGGKWAARRAELSAWLDATNPDLSAFEKRGGKMIVAIGTNDTLASPGSQLDYYQSVLDKMGRSKVDSFARLYVLPQTGHGLSGNNYTTDGDGKQIEAEAHSEHLRSLGAADRLGGERQSSGQVDQGDSRRKESANVFVSGISQVQQGTRQ